MLKIFGTKKFFGTRFVASFTRRLVFSPNNEANKFIYLFIIASKKDIKKETNSLFSHFSSILNLFLGLLLRTFHPILLLHPFYPTVDRRRRRRDASKSLPQLVDVDFHPMIKVSRLYIVMIKVRGFLRGS